VVIREAQAIIRYGGKDEPPSCLMLVEPVSPKQPVTILSSLMGCPSEAANPVIEPDSQADNAADDVDERLKDAYCSDTLSIR